VKRLVWIPVVALALLALAACAPTRSVVNNVVPMIVSVQVPEGDGPIVLQGRYFGDGQGGQAEDSYVVIGARSDCSGGVQVEADTWTANRITVTDPGGVGYGFVCVVSKNTVSNPAMLDID
jgi:hypothetical protein